MNGQQTVDQKLQVTKIIGWALPLGVAIFMGVAIFLRRDKAPDANTFFGFFGAGFAILCVAMSQFVPNLVSRGGIRQIQERGGDDLMSALAGTYLTSNIIRAALLEGGAFLNLVLYIVSGQFLNLIIAAVLLGVMLLFMPGPAKFHSWVQQQRDSLGA